MAASPFAYCLNTSTLRGQKLRLVQEIDIAAEAGYNAIEPWIREIDQHVEAGGSVEDLAKQLRDRGLAVAGGIGFAEWIVDDDARRARGLEQAKREMDRIARIGGTRLAAPPVGATDRADLDLRKAAERYRALLDLGVTMGVTPQLELWGFSQCLSRLSEVAFVAVESGHPNACLLLDVYHLHRGGSSLDGLKLLSGSALHVFHVNDYPANIAREKLTDADRVYPGDGDAPLDTLFRDLQAIGFRGTLSLELFNKTYWQQDALTVARTGLEKTRAAVARALGG